jgi:Metallo-peptidase family M12B Reprolysin-like
LITYGTRAVAITAVLSTAAVGMPAAASQADPSAPPAAPATATVDSGNDLLAQARHGERAVTALADDLDVAAARNDVRPAELRSLLRSDRTAWLDAQGRLFYIDPAPASTSTGPAEAAPYPYDQTFLLHSNPGSNRVVYLDFDGHAVVGTLWNSGQGVSTATQPPFDTDSAPGTFSATERDVVQSVWQRVSEDYAPFGVDVTTQDPGLAALERSGAGDDAFGARALITPSDDAWLRICNRGCGGVAYVGSFVAGAQYQPAWIFPQALGNAAKTVAEAVTHEVGHNLGLHHDGVTGGTSYYAGHGAWAPIMGVGYNRPITQWSTGEYTDADNLESDLSVIQDHGLALRVDEHGDTRLAATPLQGDGATPVTGTGRIGLRTDLDLFRVSRPCTGTLSASATPAPTSPDLDLRLSVLDGTGTLLASADPDSGTVTRDQASGLGAALEHSVPAGTYYLEIDGVGAGAPASTGYSDYASLGTYSLEVRGCNGAVAPMGTPGAPRISAARPGVTTDSVVTATARWRPPVDDGGTAITGYRVTALRLGPAGGVVDSSASGIRPPAARSLTMVLPRRGQYAFTVRAVNTLATSVPSARSAPVAAR